MEKLTTLLAALAALLLLSCGATPAALQGHWVLVSGQAYGAGLASAPTAGEPLGTTRTADVTNGCFTSLTLDKHFGAQCANHETEGGAAPTYTGVLTPGAHPTPGEVRWYCDKHTVVRVVISRCSGTDSFHVSEIDLAKQ